VPVSSTGRLVNHCPISVPCVQIPLGGPDQTLSKTRVSADKSADFVCLVGSGQVRVLEFGTYSLTGSVVILSRTYLVMRQFRRAHDVLSIIDRFFDAAELRQHTSCRSVDGPAIRLAAEIGLYHDNDQYTSTASVNGSQKTLQYRSTAPIDRDGRLTSHNAHTRSVETEQRPVRAVLCYTLAWPQALSRPAAGATVSAPNLARWVPSRPVQITAANCRFSSVQLNSTQQRTTDAGV